MIVGGSARLLSSLTLIRNVGWAVIDQIGLKNDEKGLGHRTGIISTKQVSQPRLGYIYYMYTC